MISTLIEMFIEYSNAQAIGTTNETREDSGNNDRS